VQTTREQLLLLISSALTDKNFAFHAASFSDAARQAGGKSNF